jgi:histidinol-phosphate aminotransferase
MQAYAREVVATRGYFEKEVSSLDIVKQVYPSQGNFLLIEFVDFDTKMNVFNTLSDHNIFVRNLMHNKLLTNALRITIGTKAQMERVLNVIKSV